MPRIILFAFLFSFLSGCYDDKPLSKHGLSNVPLTQFTYRGVVDRTVKLKLKVEKGGVSKLTARIETEYDYDFPLNYEWKLGEGVQLSSGDLKGQISAMKKNTPLEIELDVIGFTGDIARFVRFEVLGTNPQKRVFADGVFSSQDKSFEKIVQEIEEYKKSNQ
ncbi:hypothetical protein CIK05_14950 [Bdellovibrio sp. qaytius]|nr:hypothetical protein CIK05_14950 [Bdellovibrio sp. qaytius]